MKHIILSAPIVTEDPAVLAQIQSSPVEINGEYHYMVADDYPNDGVLYAATWNQQVPYVTVEVPYAEGLLKHIFAGWPALTGPIVEGQPMPDVVYSRRV